VLVNKTPRVQRRFSVGAQIVGILTDALRVGQRVELSSATFGFSGTSRNARETRGSQTQTRTNGLQEFETLPMANTTYFIEESEYMPPANLLGQFQYIRR